MKKNNNINKIILINMFIINFFGLVFILFIKNKQIIDLKNENKKLKNTIDQNQKIFEIPEIQNILKMKLIN